MNEPKETPTLHVDPYERIWMILGAILIAVFLLVVAITAFGRGFVVPGPVARVDPNEVANSLPFSEPGLRELAPGKYEAYILSRTFLYQPREITVPVGSTVTFYVTSADVQHGFAVEGTNVNMQIVPGQVSKLTTRFDRPGEYNYICHEYCGAGHAAMYGKVIVTP
jgi:cytochrome c oxidase subunit 2